MVTSFEIVVGGKGSSLMEWDFEGDIVGTMGGWPRKYSIQVKGAERAPVFCVMVARGSFATGDKNPSVQYTID